MDGEADALKTVTVAVGAVVMTSDVVTAVAAVVAFSGVMILVGVAVVS